MDGGYFRRRRAPEVDVQRQGARATFASQKIPHTVKAMSGQNSLSWVGTEIRQIF